MTHWSRSATRVLSVALLLASAAALLSCFSDPAAGRGAVAQASLDVRSLLHQVQGGSDGPVDVVAIRTVIVQLSGASRREVASRVWSSADLRLVDTDPTIVLQMSFPYRTASDEFELVMQATGPLGDTLYRAGPSAFTMRDAYRQGGQAAVTVEALAYYVGPGASAVRLSLEPRTLNLSEGQSTVVTATLLDATGTAVPTVGVEFWSLDSSIAVVKDRRVGSVTGGNLPGNGRLAARWDPKKLEDTIIVTNKVPVAQLQVGNGVANQSTKVGSTLPVGIAVRALSSAGFPLQGVVVTFVVTNGGGRVSAGTVTTDAGGHAITQWTVGPTAGPQQLSISTPGGPSFTISATAVP